MNILEFSGVTKGLVWLAKFPGPVGMNGPPASELKIIYLPAKYKSSPATRHADAWGERRYSSYSFSTSALDGGE
jgi:hypothetical protein